jgi:hypothetical protein
VTSEVKQMLQGWSMESRADAHRRDLVAEAEAYRIRTLVRTELSAPVAPARTTQLSATGLPVAGGRTVRRPGQLGQKFGAWLIEAGTRLGGTTISTS